MIAALLIHGVLLYFFHPLLRTTKLPRPAITVEFLNFPPQQSSSVSTLLLEETITISAKPPPVEKKSPPLVEKKIEPEPPGKEIKPQPPEEFKRLLNELIQEKEAEQLSMALAKEKLTGVTKKPTTTEKKNKDEEKNTPPENEKIPNPQQEPRDSATPPLPEKYFLRSTFPQKEEPTDLDTTPLRQDTLLPAVPLPLQKHKKLYPTPNIPIGPQSSHGMLYGLSDYNWPYESYMGRWAKGLLYSWRNHPPPDYISGNVPQGGNVFVQVTLNLKGELIAYEVTDVERASRFMVDSVLDAISGTSNLPPLPNDFKGKELQVHFKFIYPSLYHLFRKK